MLKETDISNLKEIAGEKNVSNKPFDLLCYSRDLAASIPDELLKGYGMVGAEAAVLPNDAEQISKILAYAHRHKIPVTPRGAASWALGGVLPMEGGIVVDTAKMNNILEFSQEDQFIRVQPGIEWKRIIDFLEKRGFTVGANPSSGASATIGGYIATGGGAGIGVTQFGSVGNQIISMKVALADGRIVETNPWSSFFFVGSEGTLGIICEITLKVFPMTNRKFFMFGVASLDKGCFILQRIYDMQPYYVSFLDKGLANLLNSACGHHFKEHELTISAVFQGTDKQLENITKQVESLFEGCYRYSDEDALHEWKDRYRVGLAFKKLGPSLFAQDFRVPVRFVKEALQELAHVLKGESYGVESLGGENGSIVLAVMVLADERDKVDYIRKFAYASDMANIAKDLKGAPLGLGLHNSMHISDLYEECAITAMKKIRAHLDSENILNPSKTTQVRIPALFVNMSMMFMRGMPEVVALGLKATNLIPSGLLRFGLKIIGSGIK
ncbi:MAG: FAD-binding oxidoreductase [Planctomycetota bacterium]